VGGADVVAFCDVCDNAPGLSAPDGAPVTEHPPGLNDGAFTPDIGDCALTFVVVVVVVCPPPTNNCKTKQKKKKNIIIYEI
jgi:hypothetical protein